MKHTLFFTASLLVMLLTLVACGGETDENTHAKKLPVDNRAQQEQAAAMNEQKEAAKKQQAERVKVWDEDRRKIEETLENSSGYYQTGDGEDEETKEYTTYYLDEAKTTPLKTRYTYNTGSFDMVYWLPNGQVWLTRNGNDYFVEGDEVVLVLNEGEPVEATREDQESALKVAARARAQFKPTNYRF